MKQSEMSILTEAAKAVYGERNQAYGHPQDNHQRTAELWSAYLNGVLPLRRGLLNITPTDVCILNILQKISRLANGYHRDSCVDIAGYAENICLIEETAGD